MKDSTNLPLEISSESFLITNKNPVRTLNPKFPFRNATELFLGAISTFTSYELMDYDKFIKLAVITSMLALPRPTLREKICQGSEIAEVLHDDPATKQYLFSFYNSQFQTVSFMIDRMIDIENIFSFSDAWHSLNKNWKWTDFWIHITNITLEKWESWLIISNSR